MNDHILGANFTATEKKGFAGLKKGFFGAKKEERKERKPREDPELPFPELPFPVLLVRLVRLLVLLLVLLGVLLVSRGLLVRMLFSRARRVGLHIVRVFDLQRMFA